MIRRAKANPTPIGLQGEDLDGVPADEGEHFMKSPECGVWFDMRSPPCLGEGGRRKG